MELVKVGSVVVLTTSETATTWVLAVLSNTTMTGGNVAAMLASLGEPGGHGVFLRMLAVGSRQQCLPKKPSALR